MSAFVVSTRHIDALLTAGLSPCLGGYAGPLRWMAEPPEESGAYQRGEPWGPTATTIWETLSRRLTTANASNVGRMLLLENERSVAHRYDEAPKLPAYTYRRYLHELEPVAILKALDCYEYQSCEHPGWQKSEAHAFCEALRRRAIAALPGYEQAPWGV